jgi:hypothetical protein
MMHTMCYRGFMLQSSGVVVHKDGSEGAVTVMRERQFTTCTVNSSPLSRLHAAATLNAAASCGWKCTCSIHTQQTNPSPRPSQVLATTAWHGAVLYLHSIL